MKIHYIFSILIAFGTFNFVFGQNASIKGTVKDQNGEPIIGATVYIIEHKMGTYTNDQGIYSFSKLPEGSVQIRFTYLGYDTVHQTIELKAGKTIVLNVNMKESAMDMETIEIVDEKVNQLEPNKVSLGLVKISSKEINMVPTLGTPDLAQYLQVVPGVVFTGDQGGQLYIRGGTPIQNMTYLDGAIIYQPFHSIGLFSVFDTDILRNVNVYSAGFSAEYGGRVSSVMDIETRNGNFNKISGKFHTNPFTSGGILEGPIFKLNGQPAASFLISSRALHIDKTSLKLYRYINDTIGLPFNFFDIYGKTTFGSGANSLNLFGFYQTDNVNYGFPSNYRWKSFGGGTQFRFLPANSLMNISGNLAFSDYKTTLQAVTENFDRFSQISGFNGSLNFGYIFNSVDEFNYGIQFLGFRTDFVFTNSLGLITSQQNNNTEAVGYFKYKKVIRKKIELPNGEVSYVSRWVFEPSIRLHYYNDHSYISPEPRLRTKLNLGKLGINLATGLYSQNLVAATSDKDIVVLFQGFLSAPEAAANQRFKHNLQTGFHHLLGFEYQIADQFTAILEGWYKGFQQVTNINRDKMFPADPNFITEKGWAYGADFVLKYQTKKIFAYATYGWAKVQRDDFKMVYFTVFDRRHTANLVLDYKLGEFSQSTIDGKSLKSVKFKESKWEFSTRWTLGSGFPFTQTQSMFEKLNFYNNGSQTNYTQQNGNLGFLLSENYNGARLPYFHRLDLSIKRRFTFKDKVLLEVNANAINAYNRQNIFYFDRIRYSRVDQLPIVPTAGISVHW